MLKAQMLATALNWYFPTPLGGTPIDVRHASAAFGGAGSVSPSQALDYAASRSNRGGSDWYRNDKETQVMAKDVFEEFNRAASSR